MPLNLAWWNTGLSPKKKKIPASPSELLLAAQVLSFLLIELGMDFVALGEIAQKDIDSFRFLLATELASYEILPAMHRAGGSSFDTCIVYRKTTVDVTYVRDITDTRDNTCVRAGQRFCIECKGSSVPLHVFISHWPSRLRGDGLTKRLDAAVRLRGVVDELQDEVQHASIVLMGDYNDEPCDESVRNRLKSSRERAVVQAKPRQLYNPFWQCLASPEGSCGTHYFPSGSDAHWFTFDQMLFSSAIVTGKGGWSLGDPGTAVLTLDLTKSIVEDKKLCFDHLPIVAKLQRNKA